MLRSEIERGVAAGDFDELDVRGAATAAFSLCIDVARWYAPTSRRSADEIGTLYGDLVMRMLSRRPERRASRAPPDPVPLRRRS